MDELDSLDPKDPFDPECGRRGAEVTCYDPYIEGRPTPRRRIQYIRSEEGTFNPVNGHFLCDDCYIKVGQPSSPSGWRCP